MNCAANSCRLAPPSSLPDHADVNLPRFYADSLDPPTVRLDGDEARHAARVRRLQPGDEVQLFDGRGGEATGTLVSVSRESVEIRIERRTPLRDMTASRLTVASAIPKGSRAEWMVEKLSELGVAALWPLVATRSVVEPGAGKIEKWRRIAREASKQCGRNDVMQIVPPVQLDRLLPRLAGLDRIWLAEPSGIPADPRGSPLSGLVLIGPEGGFDDAERAALIGNGAAPLRIARHILRVETAAVAAAAILLNAANVETTAGGIHRDA